MQNKNTVASGHWIWSRFDEHNHRFFGGRLVRPQEIIRSSFKAWRAGAVNKVIDGTVCRLIWIDGELLDADTSAASDSLLHEMIHYELAGAMDGDGDQNHGPRFVTRANEIGRELGLLPCDLPGFTPEQVSQVASSWPVVQREVERTSR